MRASDGCPLEVLVTPDFDQVTRRWGDHFGDEHFIVAGTGLVDERGSAPNQIRPYTEGFRLNALLP
jgi:hypothetical protein